MDLYILGERHYYCGGVVRGLALYLYQMTNFTPCNNGGGNRNGENMESFIFPEAHTIRASNRNIKVRKKELNYLLVDARVMAYGMINICSGPCILLNS